MPRTVTIKSRRRGQKPLRFTKGGLHASTATPPDEKIPASKMMAALAGKYGTKAEKQAQFAKNVLAKGRRTAARRNKR
jgi:hypothetical protein